MKPKPELSDQEIRSYMDFEGLLAKQKQASSSKNVMKWRVVLLAGIVAGVFVWLSFRKDMDAPPNPEVQLQKEVQSLPEPEVGNSPVTVRQDTLSVETGHKQHTVVLRAGQKSNALAKEKPATENPTHEEALYVQAEPVMGYADLYQYFSVALVYPQAAIQDSVQGVATVVFVINKDGKPEDIKVTQSLGPAFDTEAIRLIQQMPAWKPATYNGKPVKSKIALPLTFQLKKIEVSHEQK